MRLMPQLLKPTALLISLSRPSPSPASLPSQIPVPLSPSRVLVLLSKNQSKKRTGHPIDQARAAAAAMGLSWCRGLRLLFVASLLVLSAAALQQPSPRAGSRPPPPEPSAAAADTLLARMCDPRGAHPAPPSWCHTLHLRRRAGAAGHRRHNHHHHRPVPMPLPPPGRDGGGGEEIDVRYGVAKRLVPTGPNPLHN